MATASARASNTRTVDNTFNWIRSNIGLWLTYVFLTVMAILTLAPLVWVVATSLRTPAESFSLPPQWIPVDMDFTNYQMVFDEIPFWSQITNSFIITFAVVAGQLVTAALAGYAFARLRFPGRNVLFWLVLATMMIPFPVLMAPLYVIFKELGWIGSFRPLWVPAWFGHAFSIFLLRQYFMTIPKELDEAARIDGCGHIGIFTRIILPLSRPAIAVVALFYFIFVWNDFLGPLIFLQHRDQFTLALGLQAYQSQAGATSWNLLMAASVMVILPVLVLFFLTQRTFVEGIATQGLKE